MACLLLQPLCLGQITSYTISTVAGAGTAGYLGDGVTATSAYLDTPEAVAVDSSHNIYIADSGNQRIRKVVLGGKITTVAGNGTAQYAGDGGAAISASLDTPYGVAVDPAGNIYIADLLNHVVREVTASNGNITTFAGINNYGFSGDGGPAASAQMNQPFGLALDAAGDLFIADSANNRVREVTTDGIIHTVAGNGNGSFSGDGGPALSASLNAPYGIAVDSAGNLYIADSRNNRIRIVTPDGKINTFAGNGKAGATGDGGPATSAELNRPIGLAVNAAGDVLIADYNNSLVRVVNAAGIISTIAGNGGPGYTGDGGPSTNAKLDQPSGLAVDNAGNVYIADNGNNVIRMMVPTAPSVSSGGVIGAGQFGALPAAAPGSWIEIYGTNLSLSRRSWTNADFQGSNAPTSLDNTTVTIGGQAAFIDYISGTQIDAQVPSNVQTGSQQLIVKTPAGSSSAYSLTVNATEPGLWAPSQFNLSGKQYVGAYHVDGTFVLPTGAIPGVTSSPATASEIITMYGVGFGTVTPSFPAGQTVNAQNNLNSPLVVNFGSTAGVLKYEGLAPPYVGLYQFNVVVPNGTPTGAIPLTFTLNGVAGTQILYTAVQ